MNKRKKFLTENVFNQKPFMDSMVRLTESAEEHNVVDKLSSIQVPNLIVCCENDYITPMAEQKQLNDSIKGSELIMLPNTGHASMYERPVVFASIVLGYINLEQTEFYNCIVQKHHKSCICNLTNYFLCIRINNKNYSTK